MSRHLFSILVFVAGLAVVGWIAAGYVGSNPLALAVTLLIAAVYLAGALELWRYRQASATLARAVARSDTPASLEDWLGALHASLRNAVRLRLEGVRIALPAPALTPYLVGLLVLLGMLGTFLGMVATLRGTGLALENATDLQAIRASLAAPIKGLGFAFGTSIAGVAASAMLGLLAALARRERQQAAQALDTLIATGLRSHSAAHQRDERHRLALRQADALPLLVDRLQEMMTALTQQSAALQDQMLAQQHALRQGTEAAYERLAERVAASLHEGVTASARAANQAIEPAVQTTMATLTRDTAAWQAGIAQAIGQQLESLAGKVEASTGKAASAWTAAMAQYRDDSQALIRAQREAVQAQADAQREAAQQQAEAQRAALAAQVESQRAALQAQLDAQQAAVQTQTDAQRSAVVEQAQAQREAAQSQADSFARHTAELLQAAQLGLQRSEETLAGHWNQALSRLEQSSAQQAERQQAALAAALAALAAQTAEQREHSETLAQAHRDATQAQADTLAQGAASLLAEARLSLADSSATLAQGWDQALSRYEQDSAAQAQRQQQALQAATESLADQSASLIERVDQSHAALQAALAEQDQARLASWQAAIDTLAGALRQDWQQAGSEAATRQQAVCDTLAATARELAEQSRQQSASTIAEIAELAQAATLAPKAAAEVIAELRQHLSDSMVRDNAMLDERVRLLDTMGTLHEAVNHACQDQRAAIDALVGTSAELLERIGARFTDTIDAGTRQLHEASSQLHASATGVAGLGEAFAASVQGFQQTGEALLARLQGLGDALEQAGTRGDEQLAYYVAQAREVVDLCLLSQKQILEELRLRGNDAATPGGATA